MPGHFTPPEANLYYTMVYILLAEILFSVLTYVGIGTLTCLYRLLHTHVGHQPTTLPGILPFTMVWHFFLKLVKASESQPARRKVRGNIIPW